MEKMANIFYMYRFTPNVHHQDLFKLRCPTLYVTASTFGPNSPHRAAASILFMFVHENDSRFLFLSQQNGRNR